MILEEVIRDVAEQQQAQIQQRDSGLIRDLQFDFKSLKSHALVITGIRRCGKSTLLLQLLGREEIRNPFYLNFETPQFYNFTIHDFVRLDQVIRKEGAETLLLDEIQFIEGWEWYVRQKLDEGFGVIVTGSNASMLETELGTKLTGRHLVRELFPFSYPEFLRYQQLEPSPDATERYLHQGGFPGFLKDGIDEHLTTLFDNILSRDIVARYGIKDVRSLQRLALFLFSNAGNRITATKLKQPLGVGATSTILNWFSHLEMSYMVFFLPCFSHSYKAQLINPRKVYAIDTGMLGRVTSKPDRDPGHRLENMVYLHLRRCHRELFYFDQEGECDFVVMKNNTPFAAIQVTHELTPDNQDREINGLLKAMEFFDLKRGVIVTMHQKDQYQHDKRHIDVLPGHEFLMAEGG